MESRTAAGQRNQRAAVNTPGPWSSWRGSRAGRFFRFTEKYLQPPRQTGTFEVLPWQRDFVEAFYAEGVKAAVLGMARGGGKSTLMAALATFDLFEGDAQGAPFIPIVAKTLGQARDEVYSQVVAMVQAEPELKDRCLTFSGIGTERILVPRTRGTVVPRAADPGGLQGMNIWPAGYVDEIGHIQPPTWDAVLLGRKRPGARVLGAGTWGPDTASPLYLMRKLVREGNAPESLLWRVFMGSPGASLDDEENWRKANPSLDYGMPDLEGFRNDMAMTPEAAFRTYHLNEPDVVGHDSWLGSDARSIWEATAEHWNLIPGSVPTYVGVDVGLVRDCTAVVHCQFRGDGRLHAVAKIWTPMPGRTVDIAAVTQYLRDLAKTYLVAEISYDPRLFELPAIYLRESRLPMVEVPQSVEQMTPIVGALFELIQRQGLTHEVDENFTAHVVNAVPRLNERGFTLSKSKSAPRGHIDACIALALAVDRANHAVQPTGVYVTAI